MKNETTIGYLFPLFTFIIFVFAALISFIQLFGYCAMHFEGLTDSIVLAIIFLLAYMIVFVEFARAAEHYIENSLWMVEKHGLTDPALFRKAFALMVVGAVLCVLLTVSGLFLPYGRSLPKLLLFYAGLVVCVLLILRPCVWLRKSCNKKMSRRSR